MKQVVNKIFISLIIIAFTVFTSCSNSETKKLTDEKQTSADTTVKKEDDDIAELTSEQIKAVGIEIGTIEQKNLTSVVKASGQLTVPPQNKAVVNALVGGVIRKINVVEGQYVRKGQVVVTIENPDFIRLQQDYLTSKDNLVYLAHEYERQKELNDADAGIGKVYQQASANYAAEKSKLLTLEKQLQQIHISPLQISKGNLITQVPVLSPISGTVGHINLSIGTYTDATSPIMEIVNNSTIYCELQVYEQDIAKIRIGQKIDFTLTNQTDKQISGLVSGINKSFEGENKSVIVHATLSNVASLNLIPGMYVSGLIETGKQLVSAVPKDAIVKANDKQYIFVFAGTEKDTTKQAEQNKDSAKSNVEEIYQFKKIEVVTGVEESGYVEIKLLKELPPNTKIATTGAFFIYSKMQNTETNDLD